MSDPAEDPRRQSGAYVAWNASLYEVIGYQQTGSNSGKLHAVNALTEGVVWLTAKQSSESTLVRAAPETPSFAT